ncbi:hypothetical protein G6W61_14995 [Streptomyces sp. KAI-26]|uniref:hypothetical protein n=1 Tax=Streptomyces sp. KAI-26 TaxID=1169747 RepID=UPI001587B83A|nr:hypothetical protein [Streptomyces sp. KAI-26]NUV87507.1 hypothetical protein [Streptomyces sp. KAI-26]NUW22128.1 hypothetical protein [Streptomyces roseoviolaceus]
MRKAITAQDFDLAGRIGIAAYRIANADARRVLETYLGPNAARRASLTPMP